MAGGRSGYSIDDVHVVLKSVGLICLVLGAVHRALLRARLRARLNRMRFERFVVEVETQGELSAPTSTEDRAHRAHVERLCQHPEYQAKLAAVKSHRAAVAVLIKASKVASAKVREARRVSQAAREAGAGAGAAEVAGGAGDGSEAKAAAEALQRLGAAHEVSTQCTKRLKRASDLWKRSRQEARQVRMRIIQQAENMLRRTAGAPREQAGAGVRAAAATAAPATTEAGPAATAAVAGGVPRVAGKVEYALLGGDRNGVGVGDGSAATATMAPMEMEMGLPVDSHALEEGRRLL